MTGVCNRPTWWLAVRCRSRILWSRADGARIADEMDAQAMSGEGLYLWRGLLAAAAEAEKQPLSETTELFRRTRITSKAKACFPL